MFLHHLALENYRQYAALEASFEANKVILLGDNAQGKTTILEAIGLLATGKSPIAAKDADLVRWEQEQAIIRARVTRPLGELALDMLVRPKARRAFRLNGVAQTRMVDVLGKLLIVLFRSEDLLLIKGGPVERRSYMDTMLIQLYPAHHQHLADYLRVMTQRNHVLRNLGKDAGAIYGEAGRDLLAVFDEQLIPLALAIWKRRMALIASLKPLVATRHAAIAEGKENLELRYLPATPLPDDPANWEAALREALESQYRKEVARGQTLVGPHRDDLELLIDDHPAKQFGSQGQQRTAVLALKLAELDHIRLTTEQAPILLLDDVLAELDVRRQNALLGAIGDEVQTFVTSTHLNDFSADWLNRAEIVTVERGQLTKTTPP